MRVRVRVSVSVGENVSVSVSVSVNVNVSVSVIECDMCIACSGYFLSHLRSGNGSNEISIMTQATVCVNVIFSGVGTPNTSNICWS